MDKTDTRNTEQEIAKDYMYQIQAAQAQKNRIEPTGGEEFKKWASENTGILIALVEKTGTKGKEAQKLVKEYQALIASTPVDNQYQDISVYLILKGLVDQIEDICRQGQIPVRNGVVFGSDLMVGLDIGQKKVMMTEVSIISMSMPFIPFCNMISKALALSMPHTKDNQKWRISNDVGEVLQNIKSQPKLFVQWAKIISSYAIFDWQPQNLDLPPLKIEQNMTRVKILSAMEQFIVAHEYGHHILRHGDMVSSENKKDMILEEYEADYFARGVFTAIGSWEDPINLYSMSGAGAVIMLGALDLVEKAKATLISGADKVEVSKTHPMFNDRINMLAQNDQFSPVEYQEIYIDMRKCYMAIFSNIWDEIKPIFYGLHEDGVRPIKYTIEQNS